VAEPTPPRFEVEGFDAPAGVFALRLAGELDIATTGEVGERLGAIDGVRAVVLDMTDVVFIDSTMLRVLLTARDRAGRVVIASATPAVRRLLELTRTDELLELAETREDALARVDDA
jgi:anti-sigma B factor antagonist